jgi:hypothetical protein
MEIKNFSGVNKLKIAVDVSIWLGCPVNFILSSLLADDHKTHFCFERYQKRQAKITVVSLQGR